MSPDGANGLVLTWIKAVGARAGMMPPTKEIPHAC